MTKIELEEWRIKEIGLLMIMANELLLDENDRQRLFIEISRTISCFGLYETAEKIINEIIEDFSGRALSQQNGGMS